MTLKSFGVAIAFASTVALASPAWAGPDRADDEGLAATTLSLGESDRAIVMLKSALEANPDDPAILINLGIAHAQSGNDAEARDHFEAALTSNEVVELKTASGYDTDSRRLARRAIAMLERGEFRPAVNSSRQLTLRD